MNRTEFKTKIQDSKKHLIFKFGANWCKPCKKIKEFINNEINKLKDIEYVEIDIDDSMDLYGYLKMKKQIYAIPTIMLYYHDNNSTIPSESITSSDFNTLSNWFNNLNCCSINGDV